MSAKLRTATALSVVALAAILVGSAGAGTDTQNWSATSNVMKTKHDTVKNSISNVR